MLRYYAEYRSAVFWKLTISPSICYSRGVFQAIIKLEMKCYQGQALRFALPKCQWPKKRFLLHWHQNRISDFTDDVIDKNRSLNQDSGFDEVRKKYYLLNTSVEIAQNYDKP